MAIIKVGAPLSGIRGTLGGIVYSANGGGTYAKQWAKGPNPRSTKQSTQRTFLARMPALWQALSSAERTAWDTFAALAAQDLTNPLGETYSASGYNWFCKCNVRLLRVGRATEDPTPSQARPAAPTFDELRVTPAGSDPNRATGGTASGTDTDPLFPASNAIDGSTSNSSRWQTLASGLPQQLQVIMTGSHTIRRYRIWPETNPDQRPKTWTFQRFDSPSTWTTLQTVTGWTWPSQTWADFYCVNNTASTAYRLNISDTGSGGNLIRLVELQLYVGLIDGSCIIYPDGDFDGSPDYDPILHISQGATIARAVQYPGYREILALQGANPVSERIQEQLESVVGVIQSERSWFGRLFRQTQEGIRSSEASANTITE